MKDALERIQSKHTSTLISPIAEKQREYMEEKRKRRLQQTPTPSPAPFPSGVSPSQIDPNASQNVVAMSVVGGGAPVAGGSVPMAGVPSNIQFDPNASQNVVAMSVVNAPQSYQTQPVVQQRSMPVQSTPGMGTIPKYDPNASQNVFAMSMIGGGPPVAGGSVPMTGGVPSNIQYDPNASQNLVLQSVVNAPQFYQAQPAVQPSPVPAQPTPKPVPKQPKPKPVPKQPTPEPTPAPPPDPLEEELRKLPYKNKKVIREDEDLNQVSPYIHGMIFAESRCNDPFTVGWDISKFSNLQYLRIHPNCFKYLKTISFSQCKSLETLIIDRDCFPQCETLALSDGGKLKTVTIGSNCFSSVKTLSITS